MQTLLKPFFREPARHLVRLLTDGDYRQFCRLCSTYGGLPRFTPKTVKLLGRDFVVGDVASFLSAYQSIFFQQIYRFVSARPDPRVLDCGANVGVSVLYFKMLYPAARLTAFEPDPGIFAMLQQNVRTFELTGVELVNKAVWSSDTVLSFSSEGADAGRVDIGGDANLIEVAATRLLPYLEAQPVDLLKIDIEGAELEVLRDCVPALAGVRAAFVEFHSFRDKPQRLAELLAIMENAGFRVVVQSSGLIGSPFVKVEVDPAMKFDLLLNLFFYRP